MYGMSKTQLTNYKTGTQMADEGKVGQGLLLKGKDREAL
jgi:hypothetical protein